MLKKNLPQIQATRFVKKILLIIPIIFGVYASYILIQEWEVSHFYLQTQCTILDKKINTRIGGRYNTRLIYSSVVRLRYQVAGREFDQWRPLALYSSPLFGSGSLTTSRSHLQRYSIAQSYSCWYDPQHPEMVVLEGDNNLGTYMAAISLLSLIGIMVGLR